MEQNMGIGVTTPNQLAN